MVVGKFKDFIKAEASTYQLAGTVENGEMKVIPYNIVAIGRAWGVAVRGG